MKTKYILHGGSAQHINESNDLFYKEILKNTPKQVKILLVHFAGTEDKKESNYQRDTSQFLRNRSDKEIIFELAKENRFLQQIKNADVIYFGGGPTINLINVLSKFDNLKSTLKNKIVAGESAGANCLSTLCYSKSSGGNLKCLGILPIFICPHYDQLEHIKFKNIPDNLEKVLLKNYEFRVLEA